MGSQKLNPTPQTATPRGEKGHKTHWFAEIQYNESKRPCQHLIEVFCAPD